MLNLTPDTIVVDNKVVEANEKTGVFHESCILLGNIVIFVLFPKCQSSRRAPKMFNFVENKQEDQEETVESRMKSQEHLVRKFKSFLRRKVSLETPKTEFWSFEQTECKPEEIKKMGRYFLSSLKQMLSDEYEKEKIDRITLIKSYNGSLAVSNL